MAELITDEKLIAEANTLFGSSNEPSTGPVLVDDPDLMQRFDAKLKIQSPLPVESPSFMQDVVVQSAKDIGTELAQPWTQPNETPPVRGEGPLGAVETAGAFATEFAAGGATGIAGLFSAIATMNPNFPAPKKEALLEAQKTMETIGPALEHAIVYQPKTRTGQQGIASIHKLIELYMRGAHFMAVQSGRGVGAVTGSETAGAFTEATVDTLLAGAPMLKGLFRGRAGEKVAKGESLTAKETTVFEQQLERVGQLVEQELARPRTPQTTLIKKPPPGRQETKVSSQDIQNKIDALETQLEAQGKDVIKMFDPKEHKASDLPPGYQPMPEALAKLYRQRYAIDRADTIAFVNKVAKDTGLPLKEAEAALKELRFTKDQFSYFTQREIDTWDISTQENLAKLYNHFRGKDFPMVEFRMAGSPEHIGLRAVSLERWSDKINSEAIRKSEHVYNAIARNIGQAEINLTKTMRIEGRPQVEAQLASEVDTAIGDISPPVGLSIRKAGSPIDDTITGALRFENAATEARYQRAAKGVQPTTFRERVKANTEAIWRHTTRGAFEHIPRTAEFADLRNRLSKLQKQKAVAQDRTARILQGLTHKFGPKKFDLFTRKVLLDDLVREAEAGRDLPFGFTRDTVMRERAAFDRLVEQNVDVAEAVAKRRLVWKALKTDYITALKDIGVDVEGRLQNPDYFRHQVLEYANLKSIYGPGKRLKTPTGRGFLRKRTGSEFDINANYLEAEFEVMAQMFHDIETARVIKFIEEKHDIMARVREDAKARNVAIEDALPEGYDLWQPREGSTFYLADSLPSKIAQEIHQGLMGEMGLSPTDLRKVLAVGRPRRQYALKHEIIAQLEDLAPHFSNNMLNVLGRDLTSMWKKWQLFSPWRFLKYNLRNMTGDADAAFAGNPAGFKELPSAIVELYPAFFSKKSMHPEVREWFRRGGFETTLKAQEIGDINTFNVFENLKRRAEPLTVLRPDRLAVKAFSKYWTFVSKLTNYRETWLRYANYKSYLKQLEKNNGKPENYGASLREEIDAIPDFRDKAFKLSNELLGAYDDISIAGQMLRRGPIPFWSWKEVNFTRYKRLFENARIDAKVSTQILRHAGVSAPLAASRGGIKMAKFLLQATALWSALQVWNNTRFPEEEDSLDEFQRTRPHIILGRREDGTIIYFSNLGALGDLLSWFGLNELPNMASQWARGEVTPTEIAKEMSKSGVNTLVQGLGPIKSVAEIVGGVSFYPDWSTPRVIRDRGYYAWRSLALGNEYNAIFDRPSKGYLHALENALWYEMDPGQGAYRDIVDAKTRFLLKKGKSHIGFYRSPRGDALYNLKLAIRYNDTELQNKFFAQYLSLGGTIADLGTSLNNMRPLAGMNELERIEFLTTLDADGRRKLNEAEKYFRTYMLTGKPSFKGTTP